MQGPIEGEALVHFEDLTVTNILNRTFLWELAHIHVITKTNYPIFSLATSWYKVRTCGNFRPSTCIYHNTVAVIFWLWSTLLFIRLLEQPWLKFVSLSNIGLSPSTKILLNSKLAYFFQFTYFLSVFRGAGVDTDA